jgi:hypothetical protein
MHADQLQLNPAGPGPGVSEIAVPVLRVDLPERFGQHHFDVLADQLVAVIPE